MDFYHENIIPYFCLKEQFYFQFLSNKKLYKNQKILLNSSIFMKIFSIFNIFYSFSLKFLKFINPAPS